MLTPEIITGIALENPVNADLMRILAGLVIIE